MRISVQNKAVEPYDFDAALDNDTSPKGWGPWRRVEYPCGTNLVPVQGILLYFLSGHIKPAS